MQFIYGLSKSGISIVKYFNKKNTSFDCWDDDIETRRNVKKIFKKIKFVKPTNNNLKKYTEIYLSPGISIYKSNIKKIKRNHLYRDLNLYLKNINNQKIIAITGTNGKSTTTKLIGDIFIKSNIKTFVGGNLGNSLLNSFLTTKKYTHHVIELSSFQLELIKNFNPSVSILLNLSKDHLDRYENFRHYINQKKKVFSKNQYGLNLISIDDNNSKTIYNDEKISNKISFSVNNSKADVYLKNNTIYDNYFFKRKKIIVKNISIDLAGDFNYQNILVAYIVSRIFKIQLNVFKNIVKNFVGLPHRYNIIEQNNKFVAINNSKATNIHSTCSSLKNLKNVILILGGRAKDKNFNQINKSANHIIKAYVYGESSKQITRKIKSKIKVSVFENLDQVIKTIFQEINNYTSKTTILFAPACTSYDQYKNFEERGIHFSKLIKKYKYIALK